MDVLFALPSLVTCDGDIIAWIPHAVYVALEEQYARCSGSLLLVDRHAACDMGSA